MKSLNSLIRETPLLFSETAKESASKNVVEGDSINCPIVNREDQEIEIFRVSMIAINKEESPFPLNCIPSNCTSNKSYVEIQRFSLTNMRNHNTQEQIPLRAELVFTFVL